MNAHISFDDVEIIFDRGATPIAELSARLFVRCLNYLHGRYGAKFTLYVYAHAISPDFAGVFLDRFGKGCDWIKLGYHAANAQSLGSPEDVRRVYADMRNALGDRFVSSYCRLHRFEGARDMLDALSVCGVEYMLCSDSDGRTSYDLSAKESEAVRGGEMIERNSMRYVNTDVRLESDSYPLSANEPADGNTMFVFSHEWCFCLKGWKDLRRIPGIVKCYSRLHEGVVSFGGFDESFF